MLSFSLGHRYNKFRLYSCSSNFFDSLSTCARPPVLSVFFLSFSFVTLSDCLFPPRFNSLPCHCLFPEYAFIRSRLFYPFVGLFLFPCITLSMTELIFIRFTQFVHLSNAYLRAHELTLLNRKLSSSHQGKKTRLN